MSRGGPFRSRLVTDDDLAALARLLQEELPDMPVTFRGSIGPLDGPRGSHGILVGTAACSVYINRYLYACIDSGLGSGGGAKLYDRVQRATFRFAQTVNAIEALR